MTRCGTAGLIFASGILLLLPHVLFAQQGPSTRHEEHGATSSAPAGPTHAHPLFKEPIISCSGATLAISAQDSSVGAVLSAIRECTGAEIVIPEDVAAERIDAEVGPGALREVLNDLLSLTDFNYVIESAPEDPQRIRTVLIAANSDDFSNREPVESGTKHQLAENEGTPNSWREWLQSQPREDPSELVAKTDEEHRGANGRSGPAEPMEASRNLGVVLGKASLPQLIANMQRLFEIRKQMLEEVNSNPEPKD